MGAGAGVGLAALAALLLAGCASTPLKPMAVGTSPSCTDVVFPIYFAEGSDQLTATADQVIGSEAAQVHGCRIGYVSVLGLTDAAGGVAHNLDLSRRRAATVAKALASAGLPTPKFEVNGAGETGALTDKGRPVPLRRKTEVVIHALPT
ncbi:OmpA family protein [Caulobacter sp. S45]|uniref:OmpA family protein n=1 Tax=Caulobacter sp. S45 TaxID=1641861 RepID=UPI001576F3FF|nr:OmpA family protein [Caulobacter sp. S45]